MKIKATMLTLVTGVVISLSGPVLSAHASVSQASGQAATVTYASDGSGAVADGQDPWPKP